MTYLEAAKAVLVEADGPMTTAEVTAIAMAKGLLTTAAETPDASMSAALYRQVNLDPGGPIQRIAEPGPTRARRGSVRWVWRD